MSDDYELEEQRKFFFHFHFLEVASLQIWIALAGLLRRKKKSSEAGNLQQLAETCRKLGELYGNRGEHLKALNEYKLVAKAFNRLNMQMEVGRANRMIGEMFMLLGESEKALQYEKLYLDTARNEKDKVGIWSEEPKSLVYFAKARVDVPILAVLPTKAIVGTKRDLFH